jgi:rhodanese-related sulfurtransferase
MKTLDPTLVQNFSGRRIDVRGLDEFAAERLDGSECVPLDRLLEAAGRWDPAAPLLLICKMGTRSQQAHDQLSRAGFTDLQVLAGGLDACRKAGLDLISERTPLPLMRQVFIIAGSLLLLGLALGALFSPWFYALAWFVAAGLVLAGVTGFCPLAKTLALMPWNRQASCPASF